MLGLSKEAKAEEASWFQTDEKDRRAHRRPSDGRIWTFGLRKVITRGYIDIDIDI